MNTQDIFSSFSSCLTVTASDPVSLPKPALPHLPGTEPHIQVGKHFLVTFTCKNTSPMGEVIFNHPRLLIWPTIYAQPVNEGQRNFTKTRLASGESDSLVIEFVALKPATSQQQVINAGVFGDLDLNAFFSISKYANPQFPIF